MVRPLLVIIGAGIFSGASLQSPCDERAAPPPPRVVRHPTSDSASGNTTRAVVVVSDLCTGKALAFSGVRLLRDSALLQRAVTDNAGGAIVSAAPGRYQVRASAFGFITDVVAVELHAGYRDSVFISLRQARSLLDRITPGAPPANEAW